MKHLQRIVLALTLIAAVLLAQRALAAPAQWGVVDGFVGNGSAVVAYAPPLEFGSWQIRITTNTPILSLFIGGEKYLCRGYSCISRVMRRSVIGQPQSVVIDISTSYLWIANVTLWPGRHQTYLPDLRRWPGSPPPPLPTNTPLPLPGPPAGYP